MESSHVSILNPLPAIYPSLAAKLASVIVDGMWHIPAGYFEDRAYGYTFVGKVCWLHYSLDGTLSSKLTFQFLRHTSAQLDWATII